MEILNVRNVLTRLSISYKENSSDKIDIICPFHADKSFGSCKINSHTGLGYCFSCKEGFDAIKLVRYINKCDYGEALEFLNLKNNHIKKFSILDLKNDDPQENKPIKIEHKDYTKLSLCDLNPESVQYTSKRRMSFSFFRKFNIKLCDFGFYKDYLIFPIIDNINNVVSYEARKIKEYEYLKLFLEISTDVAIGRLRKAFQSFIEQNRVKLKDNKELYVNGEITENEILKYLLLPKTLYPKGSLLGKPTIWNYENLNRKEDLYVCEGLGSIPRLYTELSNNVTCTFGSVISDKQMELFNEFQRIIIIKDNDEAGRSYIQEFKNNCYAELFIANTKLEDTDEMFIEEIKNKPLLYTIDKI